LVSDSCFILPELEIRKCLELSLTLLRHWRWLLLLCLDCQWCYCSRDFCLSLCLLLKVSKGFFVFLLSKGMVVTEDRKRVPPSHTALHTASQHLCVISIFDLPDRSQPDCHAQMAYVMRGVFECWKLLLSLFFGRACSIELAPV